jgi:hypothetical protein
MSKAHGAKQQKKAARHKAKRAQRRAVLNRRTSHDPTVRLRDVGKLPVAQALVASSLWDDGIGHVAIARQEGDSGLVFAFYLVDVLCLGVKNALWGTGSLGEFKEQVARLEETQTMVPIAPACLVKTVKGAVEYARSFGFPPHPDYHHAARLLEGIDPSACPQEYTFGRGGKPYFIQGPYESPAQAAAIIARVTEAGGHFIAGAGFRGAHGLPFLEDELDEIEALERSDLTEDED